MTSSLLKAVLLQYYRYKKNMFVATEVSLTNGDADVVAVSKKGDISVEIEIKTSTTDLGNEWRKKTRKHETLRREQRYRSIRPNYYYICIPEKLLNDTLTENVKSRLNKKYGIMTIDSNFNITIAKKATRLNSDNNEAITHKIFLRATSELTTHYVKTYLPEHKWYV